MEIGHIPTLVTQELADAVISGELIKVVVEFRDFDNTWCVWIHLNNGIIYSLAEQQGFADMFFKTLRDALVFLKGAGVSEVSLNLKEWSPTMGTL
jgi:hypothetical protein